MRTGLDFAPSVMVASSLLAATLSWAGCGDLPSECRELIAQARSEAPSIAEEVSKKILQVPPGDRATTCAQIMAAIEVIGSQEDEDADAAHILVNTTVPNALTDYYRRKREFPESLQILVDQKKLKSNQIVDPWNTPLIYESGKVDFKICSAGADKRPGSQDDICNNME